MLSHARYRQTQNETASGPRLLVLLLQRARRKLRAAMPPTARSHGGKT